MEAGWDFSDYGFFKERKGAPFVAYERKVLGRERVEEERKEKITYGEKCPNDRNPVPR